MVQYFRHLNLTLPKTWGHYIRHSLSTCLVHQRSTYQLMHLHMLVIHCLAVKLPVTPKEVKPYTAYTKYIFCSGSISDKFSKHLKDIPVPPLLYGQFTRHIKFCEYLKLRVPSTLAMKIKVISRKVNLLV